MIISVISKALLLATVVFPSIISSSPSAATKVFHAADQSGRNDNLWGVISKKSLPTFPKKENAAHRHYFINRGFPKQIVIMGAPSSGKGTQCDYLIKKHGLVHISTGDLLRRAVSSESTDESLASYLPTIKKCMDSGKLIPDEIITQLVLNRLNSPDCREKGWILDGFPRTYAQAMSLKHAGIRPEAFLYINVPDDVAIQRVVGRRTDPVTGKSYHIEFNPPPNDEKVRRRLIVRSDDTVESMRQRLKQFRENVNAVKSCYTDIMREVDGLGSPDDVSNRIHQSLRDLTRTKVEA